MQTALEPATSSYSVSCKVFLHSKISLQTQKLRNMPWQAICQNIMRTQKLRKMPWQVFVSWTPKYFVGTKLIIPWRGSFWWRSCRSSPPSLLPSQPEADLSHTLQSSSWKLGIWHLTCQVCMRQSLWRFVHSNNRSTPGMPDKQSHSTGHSAIDK